MRQKKLREQARSHKVLSKAAGGELARDCGCPRDANPAAVRDYSHNGYAHF
jgi:hypothetical protein